MSKELDDRFHHYAKAVRDYCTRVKWDVINKEYIKGISKNLPFPLHLEWN